MMNNEQFEALYGPCLEFSDYKVGERITYRDDGQTYSGMVLWVAASQVIGTKTIPPQYIVLRDGSTGMPDVIMLSDAVTELSPSEPLQEEKPVQTADADEPTMISCPYCTGRHYSELVRYCPNNPNHPTPFMD